MKWLIALLDWLYPKPSQPMPDQPPLREKLYDYAYSCLGKDMAPLNDALGCAESLSHVLRGFGLGNPILVGTPELDKWLSANLEKVVEPLPGDIIMSVTGTGNGKARGHCGIVGKKTIMSNNSLSGKWDYHWTLQEWRDYYEKYAAIETKFYRVIHI